MIKSMTGFGRGLAVNDNYRLTVEIRAVNHRFLEASTRLPRALAQFDDLIKKQLQNVFSRGKLDVFVALETISAKNSVIKVDKELALAYYNALCDLASVCHLPAEMDVQRLASLSGVMALETAEDDVEEMTQLVSVATEEAATALLAMRVKEGAALQEDLLFHISRIEEQAQIISGYASQVVSEQKARLEQRLADLLGDIEVDQSKLANELAFFADKVDISEELTRLSSHIAQFRTAAHSDAAIGRKMEFILQEMLRETNTIGSKSNTLAITNSVIEIKSELERIREQIQNVE